MSVKGNRATLFLENNRTAPLTAHLKAQIKLRKERRQALTLPWLHRIAKQKLQQLEHVGHVIRNPKRNHSHPEGSLELKQVELNCLGFVSIFGDLLGWF